MSHPSSPSSKPMADTALLLECASFSALAHKDQKRKNRSGTPYINHPLDCCRRLASPSSSLYPDPPVEILMAALLHDVIEDTSYNGDDIEQRFGKRVRTIVEECSDDKHKNKQQRKQAQIDLAPHKSIEAKHVKLADKLSNLTDLASTEGVPVGWGVARIQEYFQWAKQVTDAIGPDVNPGLSKQLEDLYRSAYFKHGGREYKCHPDVKE